MVKQKELIDVEMDDVGKKAVAFLKARDKRDAAETQRETAEKELIEVMNETRRKSIKLEGRTLRINLTPSKEKIHVESK